MYNMNERVWNQLSGWWFSPKLTMKLNFTHKQTKSLFDYLGDDHDMYI